MRHNLAVKEAFETPRQAFPDREQAYLVDQYAKHDVILEYGCGGSTMLAASQPHSLVMSVENDRKWARSVKEALRRHHPDAPVKVHWVDTGPTMMWGRPRPKQRGESWKNYPNYALNIWDQPYFKQPDLILIDGRFRAACFLAAMMRTQRPVTVLFDDYTNRDSYHWIERYAEPVEVIGRMARFDLSPTPVPSGDLTQVVLSFLDAY